MPIDVDKLPLHGHGGLFEILERFPDPRKRRGVRHQLPSLLATALCSVLAGGRSFLAMAEWAVEQSPETLQRLGSKRGRPPSERTYRRIFADLDVEAVDRCTGSWMAAQQRLQAGASLALDGKTVRGSGEGKTQGALHLLSAIVHGSGTVVAQVAVESKTNEITQVAPLLAGLDIQGAVVTGDALLTQREIARHLVQDKQAEYVFTVKDNHPTVRRDIAELFAAQQHDAQRLQQARTKRPQTDAFPPAAPDGR